jgi:3-hydroxymyristoyl/3-hydroxydecanoyl-(acyl carrier protein) dehydratase
MIVGEFAIPAGHEVFKGHFPDFPVVPGSMVLDQVLALSGKPCHCVTRVKFFRPLEPDIQANVAFEVLSGGAVEFTCRSDAGTICSGRIEPVSNAAPISP